MFEKSSILNKKSVALGTVISTTVSIMSTALITFTPVTAQAQALEEIVVTAQRRVQSLQDVPISVLVFGGDEIQQHGIRDMRDLADFAPTVYVDDTTSNRVHITIRGFGTNGSAPTLESAAPIFVDNIHHGRSPMFKTAFLDVESIEILKGPQPVYFGLNATAGAINIRSRRPTPEWEGSGSLEYGDRQQHTATVAAGGPINDTWGIRAALAYTNDPGPITHFITQKKVGEWENISGRLSLQWKPNDRLSVLGKLDLANLNRSSEAHAICWRGGSADIDSPSNYAPGERQSEAVLLPPPYGNGWIVPHTPLGLDDCFNTTIGTSPGGPFYVPPIETRTRDTTTGHLDIRLAAAGLLEDSFVEGFWEEQRGQKQLEPYEDVDNIEGMMVVNYTLDNDMSIEWTTGHVKFFREQARDNQNTPFLENWQGTTENWSQWSTELRVASAPGGMFEWELGGFYQIADLDASARSISASVRRGLRFNNFSEDIEWQSVFALGTFNFLDNRASIDVGARYTIQKKDTQSHGYGSQWIYDVFPCAPTPQDWQGGGDFEPPCPVHPGAVQITAADNPKIFDPAADLDNLWAIPYDSPNSLRGRHVPSNWRGSRAHAVGITEACFSCRSDSGPHTGDFSEKNLDPQVILRYRYSDNMSFYARYATAAKAGGFDVGMASLAENDSIGEDGFAAGFHFLPEQAETMELGAKGTFLDGRGRYDVNLFETEFTDIQITVSAGNPLEPNSSININAGAQRTRGAEFLFAYAFSEQLRAAFGGALMDGVMSSFPNAPCTLDELANAATSGCVPFGGGAGGTIDRTGLSVPNVPDWKFSLDTEYWIPVFNDYKISLSSKAYISDGFCGAFGDCGITRWTTHGDISFTFGIGDMADVWDLSFYARNLLHPREKRFREETNDPDAGVATVNTRPSNYINYGVRLRYDFL